MTVVTVKPKRIASSFDKLFDEFFRNDFPVNNGQKAQVKTRLPYNVIETSTHFRLELAAPGLNKSEFAINLEKDILTISAKHEAELQEGQTFKRREFGGYDFAQRFHLPETIQADAIEATYEQGILRLVLPKKEEAKEQPPRKVEIA